MNIKGLDNWLTTEPEDRQDALTPEEQDFDVVYVTCKECRHQIEAGEDCPYCEKNADTGRLDTPDGDDEAA